MSRKFGVEIELTGLNVEAATAALREIGDDIRLSDRNNYRHTDNNVWKVVHDGSLDSYNSCEVVSPILEGDDGFEQIRKVCRKLVESGARVNRQCGLHVHLDAGDLNGHQIRQIFHRYARHEETIDSFMPRSRRGNANTFCMSLGGNLSSMSNNMRWVSENAYDVSGCIGTRYLKVNLGAYHRHKTVEFRQHSGTVNASKIINWVKFLQQFVVNSITNIVPVVTVQPVMPTPTPAPAVVATPVTAGPATGVEIPLTQVSYEMVVRNRQARSPWDTRAHRRMVQKFMNHIDTVVTNSDLARAAGLGVQSVPAYVSQLRTIFNMKIKNVRGQGYKATGIVLNINNPELTVRRHAPTAPRMNDNYAERVRAEREATQATIRNYFTSINSTLERDDMWAGVEPAVQSYYIERQMELSNN